MLRMDPPSAGTEKTTAPAGVRTWTVALGSAEKIATFVSSGRYPKLSSLTAVVTRAAPPW